MCERRYTPSAIAELQAASSGQPVKYTWGYRGATTDDDTSMMAAIINVANGIASRPATEHRQLVAQLLAALGRAGVDVEACECALAEVG